MKSRPRFGRSASVPPTGWSTIIPLRCAARLKPSTFRLVDSAQPPAKPVKPKILQNLAVAMYLGLGLGIGTALFQERMDNTLKGDDDVERLFGLPSLALIPVVPPSDSDQHGIH